MLKISIRELHLETGRWVREAGRRKRIVVTDRGRPVAVLVRFDPLAMGKSLPNRLAAIRKMPRIPVGSETYISEMRDRG